MSAYLSFGSSVGRLIGRSHNVIRKYADSNDFAVLFCRRRCYC